MLWYILIAVLSFAAGALVFRNNPIKGEAAAKILEDQLAAAIAKIKELEEKLLKK